MWLSLRSITDRSYLSTYESNASYIINPLIDRVCYWWQRRSLTLPLITNKFCDTVTDISHNVRIVHKEIYQRFLNIYGNPKQDVSTVIRFSSSDSDVYEKATFWMASNDCQSIKWRIHPSPHPGKNGEWQPGDCIGSGYWLQCMEWVQRIIA